MSPARGLDPDIGEVIFNNRRIALTPSGRELAIEAAYQP